MDNKLSRHIDELLRIEEVAGGVGDADAGDGVFRAEPHHHTDSIDAVLYGGLLLGQAAAAAQAHAARNFGEKLRLHSLRAYFLRRAGVSADIDYRVKTMRRGRSFAVNSLSAVQSERVLMDFGASFHTGERGFAHQLAMPEINPPDDSVAVSPMETDLRSVCLGEDGRPVRFSMPLPAWIDPVNSRAFVRDGQVHLYCWMRSVEPVADNRAAQVSAMAYLSDYCTMASVAYAHDPERNTNLFVVSLDHSMWIYHSPDVHDWHLYAMTSPLCADGRGLSLGNIYSRDGTLWASFAQEGLLRLNEA